MKTKYLILIVLTACCGFFGKAQGNFSERDTIDILHYEICLDMGHYRPAHIQGWCEVTLRMLQPSDEVSLGLMSATVDSVQVNGVRIGTTDFHYDQRELHTSVGDATMGDTLRLKVHYGSDGWVGTDGGFWCDEDLFYNLGEDRRTRPFSMGRSWFPCSDSVYDRATYTSHITVPPGWTAICSGEQTNVTTHSDNSRTFHFELQHPVSTYQVGINAAPYIATQFEAEGIYGTYPVQVACLRLDSVQVASKFSVLEPTLQLFERLFGPYRWENIRFSEGGPGSGMEHVNNICVGIDYSDFDYLIDHEFAHQWFGNLVTCARLSDMWFNEGGATFADQLASESRYGDNRDIVRHKSSVLITTPLNENGYHPLCGMPNQYSFSHTTYYKGAQVFHDLRQLLGDSTFFSMIQTLLHRNAYSCMDSYQLRDSMSLYCGRDLTDFYDFHIFHPGFASYGVDSLHTHNGVTHIWLSQRLWHAPDYCQQARIPVTFFSEQGDTMTCQIISSGRYSEGEYRLPFNPAFAIVDYYYKSASANFSHTVELNSTDRIQLSNVQITIEPTVINNPVTLHASLQYGEPNEEQIPGIKRWDYRRWVVHGDYDNSFKANTGFLFGSNYPVYDREFYLHSRTRDSLRLFYREDAGQPWRILHTATVEQLNIPFSGRTDFIQIAGTPLKGEYILAVVDTALLDIADSTNPNALTTNPRLSVSPNPASDHVEIAFNTHMTPPNKCHILVTNATGKKIMDIQPEDTPIRLSTQSLPAGIYFITLTSPTGSATKKLIIQ